MVAITFQPFWANRSTDALPSPLEAPVIKIVFILIDCKPKVRGLFAGVVSPTAQTTFVNGSRRRCCSQHALPAHGPRCRRTARSPRCRPTARAAAPRPAPPLVEQLVAFEGLALSP